MSDKLSELRELVYQQYRKVYDIEVALTLVPMSSANRELLRSDAELKALLEVSDAQLKESLISKLLDIKDTAENDTTIMQAVDKLGKMFYKSRFKEDAAQVDVNVTYKVLPRKKEQDVA